MLWPPRPDITVKEAVTACGPWLSGQEQRSVVEGRLDELIACEAAYQAAASSGQLLPWLHSELERQEGDSDKGLFQDTYETALVDRKQGRALYDALKAGAIRGVCPLCGYQLVSQLDHHAPKTKFPLLALTPMNLVPVCGTCNQRKSAKLPRQASEEDFHPYFDDLGVRRWLFVEVNAAAGGVPEYSVRPPDDWAEDRSERLRHHFKRYNLAFVYQMAASTHIANRRRRDIELLDKTASPEALRATLQDEAESCQANDPNSWETALLHGLTASDWYINGGVREM